MRSFTFACNFFLRVLSFKTRVSFFSLSGSGLDFAGRSETWPLMRVFGYSYGDKQYRVYD
jgi:hypothetical protein